MIKSIKGFGSDRSRMAYKRKRSTSRFGRAKKTRSVFTARKVGGRRYGKFKRGRRMSRNLHKFVRWVAGPVDISSTASTHEGAMVFNFSDLQNYTEFSTLYDQYQITHIQLKVHMVSNPNALFDGASANNNRVSWYPKFWYCTDHDDSGTIPLSDMKQRAKAKCIVLKPEKIFKINIKPCVLIQTYRTELTTGYGPKYRQWIDMGQTDVKHYGLKYVLDNEGIDPNDTYPVKVRIELKYWFTCKDVR